MSLSLDRFTDLEIDELRMEIVSFIAGISGRGVSPYYHIANRDSFLTHIGREAWIYFLINSPFKDVPLKIGLCPKDVSEEWYNIVLSWRLRIGK